MERHFEEPPPNGDPQTKEDPQNNLHFCVGRETKGGIGLASPLLGLTPMNLSSLEEYVPPLFEMPSLSFPPPSSPREKDQLAPKNKTDQQVFLDLVSYSKKKKKNGKSFGDCHPTLLGFAQKLPRKDWLNLLLRFEFNCLDIFLLRFFSQFHSPGLAKALLFDFIPLLLCEGAPFDQGCQTLVSMCAPTLAMPTFQVVDEMSNINKQSPLCRPYVQYLALLCPIRE
jgi:hypothetical protein